MNRIDPNNLPKATVEIRPGVFLHTIWFFDRPTPFPQGPPGHYRADFLATLLRVEDGPWELRTRIRYVMDEKTSLDSEDIKRYAENILPVTTEEAAIQLAKAAMGSLSLHFPENQQIVEIKLDGSEFGPISSLLRKVPGFHMMPIMSDHPPGS
jgi:hypothetical protein